MKAAAVSRTLPLSHLPIVLADKGIELTYVRGHRLCLDGKLPHDRVGGRIFVDPNEIADALNPARPSSKKAVIAA